MTGCRGDVGCGEATEIIELVQAREAADEKAGVDGASDALAGGDGGDDGNAGDLTHVLRGQAAALLGDQDDPVRPWAVAGEQRGQSEVTGASEDHVALAALSLGSGGVKAAVDHNSVGCDHVSLGGEREAASDLDDLTVVDGGHAQKGAGLLVGCSHEHDAAVRRRPERERRRQRRRSLTAARPGDHDRATSPDSVVTGDHALTSMNVGCRRGPGRTSPIRPVTPSDLVSRGHRAAAISSST